MSGKKAPAVTGDEAADPRRLAEEVVFRFANDFRCFSSNVKDALSGRWLHEYVKTGQLKIDLPEGIPGETLKGMTVGLLDSGIISDDIVDIVARGLRMNLIYGRADGPHSLDATFRLAALGREPVVPSRGRGWCSGCRAGTAGARR